MTYILRCAIDVLQKEGLINRMDLNLDLYSMNQMMMGQLPRITDKEMDNFKEGIISFKNSKNGNYYMLLSHENRDYTLFRIKDKDNSESDELFVKELLETLNNRGSIKSFEIKSEGIEIWINDSFYALFPYDLGVIEL